jgi:RNA polymerase sigma-70 factor (ECF subfamily)
MFGKGDEREMVLLAASGDREAFGVLAEKYRRPLTGFLARLVGDSHAANDLAQETFVRALVGLPRLERAEGFRSWLYRIGYRVAVDWRRRQGPTPAVLDGADDPSLAVSESSCGEEEHEEQEELRGRVRGAVRSIPDPYATVLLLRYYGGLSCKEMASALSVSVGNVKVRLFRARQMLRRRLDRQTQRRKPREPQTVTS